MVRTVMFIFSVQVSAVGYSIIVGLGVGVWGAMSEKFVSKEVDERRDGLEV